MAFFDELSRKAQSVVDGATEMAKDAAGVVTETAKKTADMVKINAAIIKEQHEMDKNYKTIGEWFVSEYQGEIPAAVADVVASIKASQAKVAQLQAEKESKNAAPAPEAGETDFVVEETAEPAAPAEPELPVCPICGNKSDSRFCPQCGAPMNL